MRESGASPLAVLNAAEGTKRRSLTRNTVKNRGGSVNAEGGGWAEKLTLHVVV
jgi:hypothetical protein